MHAPKRRYGHPRVPIERLPLLPEQRRERTLQRSLPVLLASLLAHGVVFSLEIIEGVDPDRVEEVVRGGPMRVRTMRERKAEEQREQQKQAREREEREREERAKERAERAEPRVEPEPVEVEVEPEPAEELELEAEDAGEPEGDEGRGGGGGSGPDFGAVPTGAGSGGGGGSGGGITLGSGGGSSKASKRRKPEPEPTTKREAKRKQRAERKQAKREQAEAEAQSRPPKPHPRNRTPVYPERLRSLNLMGSVGVRLLIETDGSVRGAKIVRATVTGTDDEAIIAQAKKAFKQAVVEAIKTWQFSPALEEGDPVAVWYPLTFDFKLE